MKIQVLQVNEMFPEKLNFSAGLLQQAISASARFMALRHENYLVL